MGSAAPRLKEYIITCVSLRLFFGFLLLTQTLIGLFLKFLHDSKLVLLYSLAVLEGCVRWYSDSFRISCNCTVGYSDHGRSFMLQYTRTVQNTWVV